MRPVGLLHGVGGLGGRGGGGGPAPRDWGGWGGLGGPEVPAPEAVVSPRVVGAQPLEAEVAGGGQVGGHHHCHSLSLTCFRFLFLLFLYTGFCFVTVSLCWLGQNQQDITCKALGACGGPGGY